MRPLRILAVACDYPPRLGGVASCAFGLLRALGAQEGVEVRVIAATNSGDCAEFDAQVPARRLNLSRNSAVAAVQLIPAISQELLGFRPDVILAFVWTPDGLALWSVRWLLRSLAIPYFVYTHGVELLETESTPRKRFRKRLSFLKRGVLREARGIFAVSRYTRDLVVRETGAEIDRVAIIPNGTDPAEFAPGPPTPELIDRYGLREKRVLLTTTRLEDYKGVDTMIAAMPELLRAVPNVVYLVVGTGPHEAELRRQVKVLKLEDSVRLLGRVARADLPAHLRLADCFVLLSREDRVKPNVEGFGIAIVEAAACGKPTLGGNSGGIGDAVLDGRTGWLVDPENPDAVAARLKEILTSPEKLAAAGREARARVESELNWTQAALQVSAALRKASDHVRN